MARAWWQGNGTDFAEAPSNEILGELVRNCTFAVEDSQKQAWLFQIEHLKDVARQIPEAYLFLEFVIPRMGRRADVIILAGGIIFVIEYKVGESGFPLSALEQTHGYGLDLKNFHETSHGLPIVPILVSTRAVAVQIELGLWARDHVHPPLKSGIADLAVIIRQMVAVNGSEPIDADSWANGAYRPTPTIIEAAQALYNGHAVQEIARSGADEINLTTTTAYLDAVIAAAAQHQRKAICFVTGVPGAGKTLVGLNLACRHMNAKTALDATYLSGNGPLVKVLRKALMLDWQARAKRRGRRRKGDLKAEEQRVELLIQNIHQFRDEALKDPRPPNEQVVIFDEAQRAWTREKTSDFMLRKKKQQNFDQSEPAFLLSAMNRRTDWCVVVCLVGEGQEINTGEAGISEWLDALAEGFRHWEVHMPSHLLTAGYGVSSELAYRAKRLQGRSSEALHLSHSVRSFRASGLADYVALLLENDAVRAKSLLPVEALYPIVRTRNLAFARDWLKRQRRGQERIGLLAASSALRLKPEGVFVKAEIDERNWFLNPSDDIRSSTMLEDVATEFQVQGLEIDWACVCWDLDLRRDDEGWVARDFSGTRWQPKIKGGLVGVRRQYLLNTYRVLLTRARQGMVIFVPSGDAHDPTRPPVDYDAVDAWLGACGIPSLSLGSGSGLG